MFFRVAVWGDRPIEDIPSRYCTGTWIAGILVDRSKPDPPVTKNDLFSAVAVVRIKVPDRNAFATDGQRVVGSDGNRVQIAEAHRLGRSRVMAGRAHQRESFPPPEGQIDCTDGRSGGTPGVFLNARMIGSISVEI